MIGTVLWVRGFRLWSRSRAMLSPTLYAILSLPLWFLTSGLLSLPTVASR